MRTVTIKFELPEDYDEAMAAINANNLIAGADEFRNFLRSEIKHAEHTEKEYELLEQIRDKFNECFNNLE